MIDASGIKKALVDEGAAAVGIAPAIELPEVYEIICRRDESGFLADMKWLSGTSKKRVSPFLHMKGARSIICTAWPYNSSRPRRSKQFNRRGQNIECIARFAHQVDYHHYIRENLKRAWAKAMGERGIARFFVDSGPIAEKAYSQLAGLGWIGKNCLLINPDIGSYFCLGLILTDLDFENGGLLRRGACPERVHPSTSSGRTSRRAPRMQNLCGECTRCIDACPTGALVEPYTLDCRRCISYLTVEHKGDIPGGIRPLIGTHIYGCDICQEACPYNMASSGKCSGGPPWPPMNGEYMAGAETGHYIGELMLMTEEDFRQMFESTNIFRLGRERFLRNVAVALDNIKDQESVKK